MNATKTKFCIVINSSELLLLINKKKVFNYYQILDRYVINTLNIPLEGFQISKHLNNNKRLSFNILGTSTFIDTFVCYTNLIITDII